MHSLLLILISVVILGACALSPSLPVDVRSVSDHDLEKICEFFREDFSDKKAVRFNVGYSAMVGDWACVMVEPSIKNEFKAEPRWALFKKEDGAWRRKNWFVDMEFKDDFERVDLPERNSRIAKLIVQKYPDCPMKIFPLGN